MLNVRMVTQDVFCALRQIKPIRQNRDHGNDDLGKLFYAKLARMVVVATRPDMLIESVFSWPDCKELSFLDDIESAVWSIAQKHYGPDTFHIFVSDALDNFKRTPGLDTPVRLHASSVGADATLMLWALLHSRAWVLSSREDASQFVSLRQGVRVHLLRSIQFRLLQDGCADDAVTEDFLSWELGL